MSATLDTKCKDGAVRNQAGMLCMAHGQGNAEVCEDSSPTLNCNHEAPIICRESGPGFWNKDDVSGPVKINGAEATTVICYENHGQDSRITETGDVAPQINAKAGTGGGNLPLVAHTLKGEGFDGSEDGSGRGTPLVAVAVHQNAAGELRTGEAAYTLNTNSNPSGRNAPLIASIQGEVADGRGGNQNGFGISVDGAGHTLNTTTVNGVASRMAVRRLTPLECERLMGFPDNHTRIAWRGKPAEQCPDGPRYKACGNSICVNQLRWLGVRINMVESIMEEILTAKGAKFAEK